MMDVNKKLLIVPYGIETLFQMEVLIVRALLIGKHSANPVL